MSQAVEAVSIPTSMTALALLGPDQFEVTEVAVPEAGPYEVLCEVHSVAICGTDKEIISGNLLHKGWPGSYPYTPGHEWSGVIVQAGPGAAELGYQPGDRVAGTAHDGCGHCRMCA
ncbi:MAG: alcohol dehydrogenase catalytic domain-containing protein, partial [Acidimicrobiia bacterium]